MGKGWSLGGNRIDIIYNATYDPNHHAEFRHIAQTAICAQQCSRDLALVDQEIVSSWQALFSTGRNLRRTNNIQIYIAFPIYIKNNFQNMPLCKYPVSSWSWGYVIQTPLFCSSACSQSTMSEIMRMHSQVLPQHYALEKPEARLQGQVKNFQQILSLYQLPKCELDHFECERGHQHQESFVSKMVYPFCMDHTGSALPHSKQPPTLKAPATTKPGLKQFPIHQSIRLISAWCFFSNLSLNINPEKYISSKSNMGNS